MKKIKDPWIAKQKFNNINKIEKKLDYRKWVEFIENHKDYFIWYEDTEDGKKVKENINEFPNWAKEKILRNLNKTDSYAEFNNKKGYYEIRICFNEELNVISTTFQKKITIKHLKILLEMATHLDALLLNNGTQIIDEEVIENLGKDSKKTK